MQRSSFTNKSNICRAAEVFKRDELEKELDFMEEYLAELDLPTVISHDDFHPFNIIHDDKSGKTQQPLGNGQMMVQCWQVSPLHEGISKG